MNDLIAYEDILLAEDDADDVFLFTLALNEVTVTAKLRHAEDGDKLFEELKKQIPDLLFLDIHMPCKDGMECIQEIRQNRAYDKMPVIMFTSISINNTLEKTFRIGANFFIDKPHSVEELAKRLRTIFSIDWKTNMIYPTLEQYKL